MLPVGTVLHPAHLGVLASANVRRPLVVRRPVVGVLSTGDELVDDGRALAPGQIRESNRPTLVAACRAYGFDAVDLGTVADDRDALAQALTAAASACDAVVSSGGVSMGEIMAEPIKRLLRHVADEKGIPYQLAILPVAATNSASSSIRSTTT